MQDHEQPYHANVRKFLRQEQTGAVELAEES
jgi:hypothetical protein